MKTRASFFSLAVAIVLVANHIPGSASLAVMSVDLSSEWLKIAIVKVPVCINCSLFYILYFANYIATINFISSIIKHKNRGKQGKVTRYSIFFFQDDLR